jgi:hypothetical protein
VADYTIKVRKLAEAHLGGQESYSTLGLPERYEELIAKKKDSEQK